MKVDVHFTPAEIEPAVLAEATVVVIDVLRATTSIVQALASGARAVFPTASTEEAVKLASSLGREDTLLCGERKGHKVEGFDLGNSPGEYASSDLDGMRLVMTTTNGTPAIRAAGEAKRVLVCAFTNLTAVARAVAGDSHVVVQCAGREGRFSFDDALCAGHLLLRIREAAEEPLELNDPGGAACVLAEGIEVSTGFLLSTAAGAALASIGLAEDLPACADLDRYEVVPVFREGSITALGG